MFATNPWDGQVLSLILLVGIVNRVGRVLNLMLLMGIKFFG